MPKARSTQDLLRLMYGGVACLCLILVIGVTSVLAIQGHLDPGILGSISGAGAATGFGVFLWVLYLIMKLTLNRSPE